MTIGYPIGTPISGANRGGTNPPARPGPTPLWVTFVGGSVVKSALHLKSLTGPNDANAEVQR